MSVWIGIELCTSGRHDLSKEYHDKDDWVGLEDEN